MKPVITVVDYGVGNLLSVCRALEAAGATVNLIDNKSEILKSEKLVLPGVGAFADCMEELRKRDFIKPLQDYFAKGSPFLGICVGMQMMFEKGEEFGTFEGLSLVKGKVCRIPEKTISGEALKVPHIGWSELIPASQPWSNGIFKSLDKGDSAYFLHSYHGEATDKKVELAHTDFGGHKILAAIAVGNSFGVQFHPERSGPVGLKILGDFINL
jgi:glutamine amidotransferase